MSTRGWWRCLVQVLPGWRVKLLHPMMYWRNENWLCFPLPTIKRYRIPKIKGWTVSFEQYERCALCFSIRPMVVFSLFTFRRIDNVNLTLLCLRSSKMLQLVQCFVGVDDYWRNSIQLFCYKNAVVAAVFAQYFQKLQLQSYFGRATRCTHSDRTNLCFQIVKLIVTVLE